MVEEMLSVIAIAEEGGAIFLDKGGAYREAEPEMGSSEHAVAADGGFGDVDIFGEFEVFEVLTIVLRLHKYFRIYLNLSSILQAYNLMLSNMDKYQTDNENDRSSDDDETINHSSPTYENLLYENKMKSQALLKASNLIEILKCEVLPPLKQLEV